MAPLSRGQLSTCYFGVVLIERNNLKEERFVLAHGFPKDFSLCQHAVEAAQDVGRTEAVCNLPSPPDSFRQVCPVLKGSTASKLTLPTGDQALRTRASGTFQVQILTSGQNRS